MAAAEIRVGNGTDAGRMMGYCPDCGLHHGSPAARASCAVLASAATPEEELTAWRALKELVALEGRAISRITPAGRRRGEPDEWHRLG